MLSTRVLSLGIRLPSLPLLIRSREMESPVVRDSCLYSSPVLSSRLMVVVLGRVGIGLPIYIYIYIWSVFLFLLIDGEVGW